MYVTSEQERKPHMIVVTSASTNLSLRKKEEYQLVDKMAIKVLAPKWENIRIDTH